jgi:hypothetical protein
MAAGSTSPKPIPDGPNAPDTPNVGDPLPPPGLDELVVVVVAGTAVVVAEFTVVEVLLAPPPDDVAVRPAAGPPA